MAGFLATWVKLIVPDKCFDEFFIQYNLLNVACYKLVLSKLLGYSIVFSSLFVKVPQIMKIWTARSGSGISVSSLTVELAVLGYAVVYCLRGGFPFSTYGELIFISLQSLVLTSLVLHFTQRSHHILPFLAVTVTLTIFLTLPLVPMGLLQTGLALTTLVGLMGKTLQIVTNYQNHSTGLLSGVTVSMLLFNGFARLYTTVMEVGDNMIAVNYGLVSVLNCWLAGQMLYYTTKTNKGK